MGQQAEIGAGAIHRFFQGQITRLFVNITIPNAIAFSPDLRFATFADTSTQRIMRVALIERGWPVGKPKVFVDRRADGLNPDGAVYDADGRLWLALWGAGRVKAFALDGSEDTSVKLPALHTTCPAFGGDTSDTLFVTSVRQELSPDVLANSPEMA